MAINLYTYENVAKILQTEQQNGRLKDYTYDSGTGIWMLSMQMKETRKAIKRAKRDERGEMLLEMKQLQEQYRVKTKEEHERIAKEITSRSFQPYIRRRVFEKDTYIAQDTNTLVVSKIISKELQQAYGLKPQNRDTIVEQLRGLLDGAMPKVVIRADVCDFYESIPQERLIRQIESEGKISSYSIKYLRSFFYEHNDLRPLTDISTIGIPRGLAFSAYLSELYMEPIDAKIRAIPGVYFYKRYVDDMVIVANPDKGTPDEYWMQLKQCFDGSGLSIHEDSKKKYVALWNRDTEVAEFPYLGYAFMYNTGQLEVLLSDKRYMKYRELIDAVFDIYEKTCHYRKWKKTKLPEDKRGDALRQLMERLRVLTGNGLLHGHKCFVACGVYYSNKYLTNTTQLDMLDMYLQETIERRFNPPADLFNYSEVNNHETNVALIKEKLKKFSFKESFNTPTLNTNKSYVWELTQLKHIYHNRSGWVS